MPAEREAGRDGGDPGSGRDKLSLIVMSGDFARVHYALVLASASAAIGKPVTLFFTDEALRALCISSHGEHPGWRALQAGGRSAGRADGELRARGVAGFEELLQACGELGVRVIACEMGLRALGLQPSDLRQDVSIEVAGVVTLLADASVQGAMLVL